MNLISPLRDAENGFHALLIEGVAALAILVLLIFLALFYYRPYLHKAGVTEGYGLARPFQVDAQLFYAHYGSWALNDASHEAGNAVQDLQLQDGIITVRYRKTQGLSTDDLLSFRPTVKTGDELPATVFWSCGDALPKAEFTAHGENRTTISPDYLTAVCRHRNLI
jgi:hypothetical protein